MKTVTETLAQRPVCSRVCDISADLTSTAVCLYQCYRRRRRSTGNAGHQQSVISPGLHGEPDFASPLDLKHSVHSHAQPPPHANNKSSAGRQQDDELFMHGPTCTVTGDHGVVCQVKLPHSDFLVA